MISLTLMQNLLISLLSFLFAISFLVVFHEFGHYLFARLCGVRVLRFSVGMGPVLWRRMIGPDKKTELVLSSIPIGGYVHMYGEDGSEQPLAPEDKQQAFSEKPLWQRSLIVLAGPAFNIILAVFLFMASAMIGFPQLRPVLGMVVPGSSAQEAGMRVGQEIISVNGKPVSGFQQVLETLLRMVANGHEQAEVVVRPAGYVGEQELTLSLQGVSMNNLSSDLGLIPRLAVPMAVIGEVQPESPATTVVWDDVDEAPGLLTGDRFLSIGSEPIFAWSQLHGEISKAAGGGELSLVVVRADRLLEGRVRLGEGADGRLGVVLSPDEQQWASPEKSADLRKIVRMDAASAFVYGMHRTWEMTRFTFDVIGGLFTGHVSTRALNGPIGIAYYAGEAVTWGLAMYCVFLALISIGLGIFNLLPLPVLDGGHLLFYLIEAIKGGPVSDLWRQRAQRFGISVLLVFFLFVCYNDILMIAR